MFGLVCVRALCVNVNTECSGWGSLSLKTSGRDERASLTDAHPFLLPLAASPSLHDPMKCRLSPLNIRCRIDMHRPIPLSSLKGKWILLEWWGTFAMLNVPWELWKDRSFLVQVKGEDPSLRTRTHMLNAALPEMFTTSLPVPSKAKTE